MPNNLLSLYPNPDNLLSLEPEELGGAIIEVAPGVMQNSTFDIASLLAPLFPQVGNAYPRGLHNQVRLALAEALSWLTNQGLVMPDPDSIASWYRLTRRGAQLKTRTDVEAFRKANLRERQVERSAGNAPYGASGAQDELTPETDILLAPTVTLDRALPQQSPRAAIFTEAEGGVIGIAPPTSQDRLANTPEVLDFYKEIREQAGYLADLGPNMLGQRLHQVAAKFQQCLPASFEEAIERRVWSHGNALRVIVNEHDTTASDPTHPHRLEPSVAETLRGLVDLFNQLAFADPSLRSRDARRPGPQDVTRTSAGLRIAVEFIPGAAVNRAITNSEAGAELSEQIEIAQQLDAVADDGLPSQFAEEHAAETFRNLVSHVILSLRKAAVYVTKEVTSGGLRAAGATIFVSTLAPHISPAIVSWFLAYSDQILAFGATFFEHVPAFRETVEWLRALITDDGRSD
jgi:hypothetical protein